MDEEERIEKGQQLIQEWNYTLGPKSKKHKELFISCVYHIFEKWMGGQYNHDYSVMYAIEKLLYKKLPFKKWYEEWTALPS